MCSNCAMTVNEDRSQAFAENLVQMLNHAGAAMMLSIGHRTKLFDVMATMPPATPGHIAERAGLSERYVREWLGAMVTAGIVEHTPAVGPFNGTYSLPAEHAAFLTRAAKADNLAQTMQWISVLGSAEDRVVEAFSHGKGVPYAAYNRFHEVMADESAMTVVSGLLDHILPLEPGLISRLERGIDVLDVGCGSGRAINFLAGRFPKSRFVGYDISEQAIDTARREAKQADLTNARFEVQDAATFTDTSTFDLIFTFDAVHDQADPQALLRNIARALKPDGVYLCQDIQGSSSHAGDIDHPLAPFIYTISCMHCMSVSLANGGIGLGAAWGRKTALQMLDEAGFRGIRVEELEHDPLNFYYIARRAA